MSDSLALHSSVKSRSDPRHGPSFLAALLTIVVVASARPASAQYMYLDANANGIHDAGDRLNANGTPTTVDLYVWTNQNRDGSPAVCDNGPEPLTINGYAINLLAVGGTVTYSGFSNRQGSMPFTAGELNPDGVRYKNGFFGLSYLAPGIRRLCTLTITGVSGLPGIEIVDQVNGSQDFTGFGTACLGRAFDNFYRLDGPNVPPFTGDVGDFTDWDGLLASNTPPVLAPIGNQAACGAGSTLTFTATATDPDIPPDALAFSLDPGAPPGATIDAATGVFDWTPSANGTFPATIRVTDNGTPPLSDFEVITIVVSQSPNFPPVLAAIGNKTVDELATLTFTATASDPTPCVGSTDTFSLDAGAPAGAAIDPTTGVFSWTPTEAQGPDSYSITIRVADNGVPPPPFSDSETITVTVNEVNAAPVLAPIGNKSASIGIPVTFTATATDADVPANSLTFSLDPGAPPGATIDASTGAFSWTPLSCGAYPVTIRVTDNGTPALSDFEAFTINLGCPGLPPVLAAIGNKTVDELAPLAFTATATDPDQGQTLTFSLDAGAPPGSVINGSTGSFSWTPTESQGPGSFPITVRVTDNGIPPQSDFETFTVTVNEVNSAPVLAPIGSRVAAIGSLLAFTATATDADIPPNSLGFSLDAGAPAGAAINASTGAFSWTPPPDHFGLFPITVRVTDDGPPSLSDFETIQVSVVADSCAPPILSPPMNMTVDEGATADQQLLGLAPDGGPLAFIRVSGPAFMTVSAAGLVHLAPGSADEGIYTGTVAAMIGPPCFRTDRKSFQITVRQVNGTPTADAGGPYMGTTRAPVGFDGTGSTDPDGDALTYAWDFGDGAVGAGATPTHAYTAGGTYNVILRVTDPGGLYDDDATTATIGSEISVTLLLKNGKTTLNLGDSDVVKLGIEELELPYTSIIVGSLRLSTDYPNAGTVAECAADTKHSRIGDLDRNSVPDLEVRFSIACVRNLFRNTPNNTDVNLIITGEFQTSTGTTPFRGIKVVTIKRDGGGGAAALLVYPNPMNPQAMLSFVTTKSGGASIQLFDLQGRLVRTLLPQQYLDAGAHEVTIDGLNDRGVRLSSGVYFYRVLTADGISEGSINVLK